MEMYWKLLSTAMESSLVYLFNGISIILFNGDIRFIWKCLIVIIDILLMFIAF